MRETGPGELLRARAGCLTDVADHMLPVPRRIQRVELPITHQNTAAIHVIESLQQRGDRGLTCTDNHGNWANWQLPIRKPEIIP